MRRNRNPGSAIRLFTAGAVAGASVCFVWLKNAPHAYQTQPLQSAIADATKNQPDPARDSAPRPPARESGPAPDPIESSRKLSVDSDLASVFWSAPTFDLTTGEFQLESFLVYGIPLEQAQRIKQTIQKSLDELNDTGLKNSTLKTEPNGDQYFVITPFPKAGQEIKTRLQESLKAEFKDSGDDRGTLLAESLSKHEFFAGFGENRIELSVENENDSGPQTIRVKRFINANGAYVSRQWVPGTNYVTKIFQTLIGKHSPSPR